ncbi:hypothetical protein FHT91_001715 [Rhizobium sp. BK347]|nr:hypothetical protein [Rhizobium sp. BK252]MBB3401489.1 hypothetical protein [Rhizobium sp. BK289]MBB3414067.1 hypothetical protein [Rhizobium sp. BK284]MBB3481954.1 hypothetical protein [Rhizobium sp. BK347]
MPPATSPLSVASARTSGINSGNIAVAMLNASR